MDVILPDQAREAMIHHAVWCAPEEACGLLAGPAPGRVSMVFPLDNVQHSPVAFTIDPEGHFRAMQYAERRGWRLTGAFHSHTTSEPVPSETDVRLAYESEWVHVIVGLGRRPAVRAFTIVDRDVTELSIRAASSEVP